MNLLFFCGYTGDYIVSATQIVDYSVVCCGGAFIDSMQGFCCDPSTALSCGNTQTRDVTCGCLDAGQGCCVTSDYGPSIYDTATQEYLTCGLNAEVQDSVDVYCGNAVIDPTQVLCCNDQVACTFTQTCDEHCGCLDPDQAGCDTDAHGPVVYDTSTQECLTCGGNTEVYPFGSTCN